MLQKYKQFVFLSAGPVGDHLVQIDAANHFYESTHIPSLIVLKHPNAFLNDLSLPYKSVIKLLSYKGFTGKLRMLSLALSSVWNKNCYVLFFPIPLPLYLKLYIYYIRFFTRSRVVGFNLEGTKSFSEGKGYASVLGKANTIPMQAEMFYVSSNRMLKFLGFDEIDRLPRLKYIDQPEIFKKIGLNSIDDYIVMHITPSHVLRTLPSDRWRTIISALLEKLPTTTIVFTGAKNDISFIENSLTDLPRNRVIIAAGQTNAQELIALYAHAKVNVTVQTGNGLMINMLHVPTVVVDIKGTAMFYYNFNAQADILFSEQDCVCNPFETECNLIPYKGNEYMACLFNIPNETVIRAVVQKYSK